MPFCVYVPQLLYLFVCQRTSGRLDCFHVLAVVNSATVCKTLLTRFLNSRLCLKVYWDVCHCRKLVMYLKEVWLILLKFKIILLFYYSNFFFIIKAISWELKGTRTYLDSCTTPKFLVEEIFRSIWLTDGANAW